MARSLFACINSFKCCHNSYYIYCLTIAMNSYRDHLWFLLGEWIQHIENMCNTYAPQLVFIKEKFLDYIVLTVHYTKLSQCKFLIRNIEDLEKIIKYLEIALLWP